MRDTAIAEGLAELDRQLRRNEDLSAQLVEAINQARRTAEKLLEVTNGNPG